MIQTDALATSNFEVRFNALSQYGAVRRFACDNCGRVDLDSLSSQDKREYLYARAMIGLEYAYPVVVCCAHIS
jgi:hypothetical protein